MTLNRVTCTLSKKTRLSQITKFDDIYVRTGLLELVSSR
jgi:hypothetical protein